MIISLLENNEDTHKLDIDIKSGYIRLKISEQQGKLQLLTMPLHPDQIVQLIRELKVGMNCLMNQ